MKRFLVSLFEEILMKANQVPILLFTFGLLGTLAMSTAHATLLSQITVTGTDQNYSEVYLDPSNQKAAYDTTPISTTINYMLGTVSFTGSAYAQSYYTGLHAAFDSTLYDPTGYYNPVYNGTYLNDVMGQADAELKDQVTVTGAPSISYIKLVMQVDGSMSQSTSSTNKYGLGQINVWQNDTNSPTSAVGSIWGLYTGSTQGTINTTVTTNPFSLDSNNQTYIDLTLQAWVDQSTAYGYPPIVGSETLDFSNTASIVGVEGFDSAGNPVAISSVTGLSGTTYPTYPTNPVPEPSTFALLGVGLGLLGWRAPRKDRR